MDYAKGIANQALQNENKKNQTNQGFEGTQTHTHIYNELFIDTSSPSLMYNV